MDLNYDWKGFQALFYTKKRSSTLDTKGPLYLVTEKKVVVSAFSEGEDLSEWIGATWDEVRAEFSQRELVTLDRKKIDEWMSTAVSQSHFYDQIQYLRSEAKSLLSPSALLNKNHEGLFQKHFLLMAVQSWWHKLLPSTYGIYISLEGGAGSSLLMIVQRGRLSSYHIPDLLPMIPERRKYAADRVRFLAERHLIPVQGLFLTTQEWEEWSMMDNPWSKIAAALKANRAKLTPFNWGLAWLIACRAYFGV